MDDDNNNVLRSPRLKSIGSFIGKDEVNNDKQRFDRKCHGPRPNTVRRYLYVSIRVNSNRDRRRRRIFFDLTSRHFFPFTADDIDINDVWKQIYRRRLVKCKCMASEKSLNSNICHTSNEWGTKSAARPPNHKDRAH